MIKISNVSVAALHPLNGLPRRQISFAADARPLAAQVELPPEHAKTMRAGNLGLPAYEASL